MSDETPKPRETAPVFQLNDGYVVLKPNGDIWRTFKTIDGVDRFLKKRNLDAVSAQPR